MFPRIAVLCVVLSILSTTDAASPVGAQTTIHPDAPSIMLRDWQREGAKERRFWRKRFEEFKSERLLFYRTERQRAVARAVAASLATQPMPLPPRIAKQEQEVSGLGEEGTSTSGGLSQVIPEFISRPANKVVDTARGTAEVIEKVVDQVDREVLGNPTPSSARSGMFVLLLIAMFLIPAAGAAALLLGVEHLRARSLRTGSIYLVVGVAILWASVSTAMALRAGLGGF